jgi:hypothetical protein
MVDSAEYHNSNSFSLLRAIEIWNSVGIRDSWEICAWVD